MSTNQHFVAMRLPYGLNRRVVRDSFAQSTGGTGTILYASDTHQPTPSKADIQQYFEKLPNGEVLILLGSNEHSVNNELMAYIVFTAAGYWHLINKGCVYPKILKQVKLQLVQSLAIGS